MPNMPRQGDIGVGVCYAHPTPQPYLTVFVDGASTVYNDGRNTSVVTTVGCASCGHATVAITGSPNVFCTDLAAHRYGDMGVNGGPYIATTGSDKQFANG